MASVLASQLQQLALSKGPQTRYVRGRPSLLYDYQQAADVDAETLYNIAVAGHEQLCRLDARFRPFADSLLSRAALSVVRDQMTAEENSRLDATLHAFLCVLTSHFLTPAAFQVLEFFIRRYKVNEANVNDLMLCALPYHTTNEFVRLVQVLALKGSSWEWLTPMQDSGVSMPRDVLVQRSMSDKAVLQFICQGSQELGNLKMLSKTYLSFYAVTVCEVVAQSKKVDEDLVSLLLPNLLAGLKPDVATDYRAATLMILTQLSARAPLGQEFLSVVLAGIARSASDKEVPTALMVLAHIAMTQPQLQQFPAKALKRFLALPGIEGELAALSRRNARIAPLLRLLLPALCAAVPANSKASQLLCGLIASVPLGEREAIAAATALLQQAGQLPADGEEAGGRLQAAVRALDLRYSQQLDAAINSVLQQQAAADGDAAKQREAVFAFVQRSFGGSSHELMQEGEGALTLAVAINAPAEAMRCMALAKLDEAVQHPDASADAHQLLDTSLLHALRDDSFAVALVALNATFLPRLPPAQLLPALASVLARATEVGRGAKGAGAAAQQKAAMKAARAALRRVGQLAARAAGSNAGDEQGEAADGSSVVNAAAALLLEQVLADRRSRKLARVALAECQAAAAAHPLLAALANVQVPAGREAGTGSDAEEEEAAAAPKAKRSRRSKDAKPGAKEGVTEGRAGSKGSEAAAAKGAAAAEDRKAVFVDMNRDIVAALAAALLSGAVPLAGVRQLLLGPGAAGRRAQHLLLLALQRATAVCIENGEAAAVGPSDAAAATPSRRGRGKGKAATQAVGGNSLPLPEVAAVLLEVLQSRLSAAAAVLPSCWQAAAEVLLDQQGLPTREHFLQLPAGLAEADGALLCKASLAALEAAPAEGLAAAVGAPAQVFERLAAHGVTALQPHLGFLVSRAAARQEAAFLSQFYGAPVGMANERVRAAALQLLAGHVAWAAAAVQGGTDARWLMRLLGAAAGADAASRAAAVAALAVVGEAAEAHGSLSVVGTPLKGVELAAVCRAVVAQAPLLHANAGALALLLRGAMLGTASAADSVRAQTPGRRRRGSKGVNVSDTSDAAAAVRGISLELSADVVDGLRDLLLQQLPTLHGAFDMAAASLALAALSEGASGPEQLFAAGYALLRQLLQELLSSGANAGAEQVTTLRLQLAAALLPLLKAEAAARLVSTAEAELETLLALVLAPHDESALAVVSTQQSITTESVASFVAHTAHLRAAALQLLTPELLGLMSEQHQGRAFRALLLASAADPSNDSRAAARSGLERLPVSAAMLLPLLQPAKTDGSQPASPAPPKSAKRGSKRPKAAMGTAAAADAPPLSAQELDSAIAALELLQWKQGVADAGALVAPVQLLLARLLPLMRFVAVPHGSQEAEEQEEEGQQTAADEPRPSLTAYAAQLALAVLQRLAAGDVGGAAAGSTGAFDFALVVRAAQEAPDSAVRNAALSLLGLLAKELPQAALEHVLQVLALVNRSAAITDDSHSRAVASTVLLAVVPAWLSAGRNPEQLWATVIGALAEVPPHRRHGLLATLLSALPGESGLPVALLLLLERASALPKQAKAAEAQPEDQQDGDECTWLIDLAASLSEQAALTTRLESFAHVLAASLQRQGAQAHGPLPRLTVALVTTQMQSKAVAGASKAGPDATALQAGCRAIMAQALELLQQLHPSGGPASTSKKVHRAIRAATTAVYELLRALEAALDPATYLQALLELSKHRSDKIVRRALKLFADRVARIHEDIEDMELLPSDVKQQRTQAMSDAAMAICAQLPAFLSTSPPLTRQTALIAADAATRQFCRAAPGPVLACLPAILQATADATPAVCGSALACVASAARALGPRLVPLLPQTLAAVMDAADSIVAALAAGGAPSQQQQGRESEQEGSDDDGRPPSSKGKRSAGEEQAMLLSGALAAVEALVASLGGFVAPSLPRLLQLLLSGHVLACNAAGAAATAARVRAALPSAIPPRLLLAPLLGQLEGTLAGCAPGVAAPAQALLAVVAAVATTMDTKAAAAHQDELFAFVLAALDVRNRWERAVAAAAGAATGLASLRMEDVHAVEQGAVAALVAFVMKLSEARFRPVFQRLLEWAGAAGMGAGAAAPIGRTVALLGAVCALSRRLRSVFVPYYKHLLDLLVAQLLGGGGGDAAARPSKKRRKSAAADAEAAGAAPATLAGWLARMRAVRALHLAFLHDANGTFLEEGRFDRLLPPLVAQLRSEAPPAEWQESLAAQAADAELDGAVKLGLRSKVDAAGVAAVGALAQMAVAGGSDARWKPLNRAVLLAGRGGSARVRLLSLEVVAQLVGRLREEYLVLLPESLPFLAELLEDGEVAVEARAQEVVAQLEEVSGEKLDDYLKT